MSEEPSPSAPGSIEPKAGLPTKPPASLESELMDVLRRLVSSIQKSNDQNYQIVLEQIRTRAEQAERDRAFSLRITGVKLIARWVFSATLLCFIGWCLAHGFGEQLFAILSQIFVLVLAGAAAIRVVFGKKDGE